MEIKAHRHGKIKGRHGDKQKGKVKEKRPSKGTLKQGLFIQKE